MRYAFAMLDRRAFDRGDWNFDAAGRPAADRDGYRPPVKLGLLLPLSGGQAAAASAVRDGFLTGYYGESRRKPEIRFYDTAALDAQGERDAFGRVRIEATPKAGQWIRRAGEDVRSGDVVLQRGGGKVLHAPVLHGHGLQIDEAAALPLATENATEALQSLSEAMRGDDARVREELIRATRRAFKQLLGTRPTVVPIVVRL